MTMTSWLLNIHAWLLNIASVASSSSLLTVSYTGNLKLCVIDHAVNKLALYLSFASSHYCTEEEPHI